MMPIRIDADEALWRNSMLPQGVLERGLVADGDTARAGHAIAQVRIEGAARCRRASRRTPRHFGGCARGDRPGLLLATVAVEAEAAAGGLIMRLLISFVSLLLDVRAHIPSQPRFGSGPADTSPRVCAVAAFLIIVAFLSAVIWMVVQLVMGFL
jgi:hypothetical protein